MWNWIKRIFLFQGPVTREVLFCKKDGNKLIVTKDILEYSAFTGDPSAFRTVKSCPECHCEVVSDVTVSL